jgi:ABC-type phosphate transport system substrate-binding protein
MSGFSVRRLISACVLAIAVAAFAVPGVASAKSKKGVVGARCSGTSIKGEGSSAQKLAQQNVWIPDFVGGTSADSCAGHGLSISYAPEGSGAGLKAFGAEGNPIFEGERIQYAGTDEPPNETQQHEIEAHGPGAGTESEFTLPVLQFSVAVIVNLPANCEANSANATGRLTLQNKTLNAIWLGEITTWKGVIEAETKEAPGAKDEITGTGCDTTKTINHIVRFDQSGTTHVFKKYLGLISTTKVPFESEAGAPVGSKDWDETAEAAENTSWPTVDNVNPLRPAKKGGGEEVAKVVATESSIGYANLADARAKFGEPEGGAKHQRFWAEVQNSGTPTETESGKKQKYADPATNGEAGAIANSNCVKEKYTNGLGTKFPPKTVHGLWNTVTTETKEKAYPLCGLTYDLVVSPYKLFKEAPAAGQATTVVDYEEYLLSEEQTGAQGSKANGGQVEIENNDYERIPSKLDKEALKGLAEVSE